MNSISIVILLCLAASSFAGNAAAEDGVGVSPWGPADERGKLNLITAASRAAILQRVAGDRVYDLSVDYFIGMPGWHAAGDPRYQIWMTHTPRGTVVDDPMGVGERSNRRVSYTGSAVSMYAHTGTHIDALNHFGLDGRIYNGFSADEHLGDRGWRRTGAETIPPIVARGVLLDVAGFKGVDMLPGGYRITRADLEGTARAQRVALRTGDVVLIRTGRMRLYAQAAAFMDNPPGLGLDAARHLAQAGAMVVGADNLSFEAFPSEVEVDYIPVHTYLLAQEGIPIMELVDLEALARDRVHEFAFVGASLRLRGADAAPMRPLAFPLRR